MKYILIDWAEYIMIQMQRNLDVQIIGRRIQCIKVLGGSVGKRCLGDVIVVSIKEAIPRGRVKGDVHRAVIVRTSKEVRRNDGTCIRFDKNAAVLVNKGNEPIGTRIFESVT